MKTLSSLSLVVVSVRPSLCSSSLSSHDFPRISYFSSSISQTCNLLASSNLSPSSTWALLRVLCLPARLSTAIRHLKLMIRAQASLSIIKSSVCSMKLKLEICNYSQVMVVYNPLGWIRNDVVRIPVSRNLLLLACFTFQTME
ncbi:alpha-mannosidase [Cucumis melo var. makuwa]|uniref:Alpha-mannosidase n=1 Tax=Cucumis melo var. makuwa TaxID=1194695 RepID=A0A5D3DCT3_CUCMM|nr:alpha-mannosidase [Cucumis melo var. makuwa]TYK21382.1 alpha-mannosidase [Cucumis melo var. makuwa]